MKQSVDFNFKRMLHVADWYALTYKSDWIKAFFIYYFALTMIFLLASFISVIEVLPFQIGMASVMLFVSFLFKPSKILTVFRTRQQRIDLLLLPASKLEKFVVLYLFSGVGMILLAFIAVLLADATKVAVCSLFQWDGAEWMFTWIKAHANNTITEIKMTAVIGYMVALWLHSLFLLGGVLFRRYAWIITTLLIGGFSILGSWLSIEAFQWIASQGYYIEITSVTAICVTAIVLLAVLTAIDFVISFILFSRMQVVSGKWCNC